MLAARGSYNVWRTCARWRGVRPAAAAEWGRSEYSRRHRCSAGAAAPPPRPSHWPQTTALASRSVSGSLASLRRRRRRDNQNTTQTMFAAVSSSAPSYRISTRADMDTSRRVVRTIQLSFPRRKYFRASRALLRSVYPFGRCEDRKSARRQTKPPRRHRFNWLRANGQRRRRRPRRQQWPGGDTVAG